MYSIQGPWSAAELELLITFVIVKNGSDDARNWSGRLFGLWPLPGLELAHLDFCGLARGQGVASRYVDSRAGLDEAPCAAFEAAEPMLVEVAVVPESPAGG